MAKPEIKISITETGADKAAAGIGKVDSAADKASKGGLKGLADRVPGVGSALDKIPGGADLAAGGITALGAAGVAGAGALAAFAVKGVMAFEQTTTAVGKFRDATGLTSEEASKLYEALSDLGIAPESVTGALGKMEAALGKNRDAFKAFGVEAVIGKDGLVDANATFLAAVDGLNKIQDATKRAEAGRAIFGKGWDSMAEVIASGAPALQKALESVQPSKVFSDKDIKSGRDVREAFDSIKDAGEGLLLTIGKSLAPAIAKIAPAFADMITKAEPLIQGLGDELADLATKVTPLLDVLGKVPGALQAIGSADAVPGLSFSIGDLNDKIGDVLPGFAQLHAIQDAANIGTVELTGSVSELAIANQDAGVAINDLGAITAGANDVQALANRTIAEAAKRQDDATEAAKRHKEAIDAEKQSVEDLISTERSQIDAKYAARKADQDADQAVAALNVTLADQKASMDDVASATDRAFDSVINKSEADVKAKGAALDSKAGIDGQIASLQAEADALDPGNPLRQRIAEYIRDLRNIPTSINTSLNLNVHGGDNVAGGGRGPNYRGATGGVVTRPTVALIGEAGPEAVVPLNTAPGASALGAGGGGGTTYHIEINMPAGSNGDDVVRAIKKYEQRNGAGWRS